jgi:sporulation protein YlmC with PRC-barrel domain
MASGSALNRRPHLVGQPDRRPAPGEPTGDLRPASRLDAVLIGATSIGGDLVYDAAGKFLGEIEELVLDMHSGRVAYALMDVGSVVGMGRKLLAIPWRTLTVDPVYQRCVIKVELERLIDAPCLDGDLLPRMADPSWASAVHAWFGCKPYWE